MASINLKHQAAPETPGTDFSKLFIDVADGKLKKKNSAGAVINLEQGQVVSVFGRTGEVVAQTGDYTASQVGADPAGTGASASAAAVAAHVAAPDPHPGYVLDGDLTTLLAGKENVGVAAALIAGLVDSAPGALDTLNELAAALGDDALHRRAVHVVHAHHAVLAIDAGEARAMVDEIRARRVLDGMRGAPPADIDALAHAT